MIQLNYFGVPGGRPVRRRRAIAINAGAVALALAIGGLYWRLAVRPEDVSHQNLAEFSVATNQIDMYARAHGAYPGPTFADAVKKVSEDPGNAMLKPDERRLWQDFARGVDARGNPVRYTWVLGGKVAILEFDPPRGPSLGWHISDNGEFLASDADYCWAIVKSATSRPSPPLAPANSALGPPP